MTTSLMHATILKLVTNQKKKYHSEEDIIIPYAHDENDVLSLPKNDRRLFDDFHLPSKVHLKQSLGEKPKILRNHKLQGNDFIDDNISKFLPEIALLVHVNYSSPLRLFELV
jgi:hypothetical protein